MKAQKRYSIKNILLTILWSGIGVAVIVLLVAAIHKKDSKTCRSVDIRIHGVSNNFFVDKNDVMTAITAIAGGNPAGKITSRFDLRRMENELKGNVWIKNANLFFDNNEVLNIIIQEREPLARLFTTTGASFYIDDDRMLLPLSDKFSARLPVFTGFPSDRKILSPQDSALLDEVKTISLAIQKDSFWMAMIDQVDITPQRTFEMIPKIGNQVIVFGDASDAEAKFRRLQLFYRKVMTKAGWNTYGVINVQYKGQVVAQRRDAAAITADSLRTLQLMQLIAANAEKQAADSMQNRSAEGDNAVADSSMVQQSLQREESTESPSPVVNNAENKPAENLPPPAAAPANRDNKPPKPVLNQAPKPKPVAPARPRPVTNNQPRPRAVMPGKNE
ncbi:MAG: hypothetical protein U0X40_09960 [Ferruginibacter sp.]